MLFQILRNTDLVLFALLGAGALVDFVVRRGNARRDIALMLVSFFVPAVIRLAQIAIGASAPVVLLVGELALVTQPYLMLRLLSYSRPVSRRFRTAALVASGTLWVLLFVLFVFPTPAPVPPPARVPPPFLVREGIALYLVITNGFCAYSLFRRAIETGGFMQARLHMNAAAAAMITVAAFSAGAGLAFAAAAPVFRQVSGWTAAISALAFYLGLSEPQPFRRYWQLLHLRNFLLRRAEAHAFRSRRGILELLSDCAFETTCAVATTIFFEEAREGSWKTMIRSEGGTELAATGNEIRGPIRNMRLGTVDPAEIEPEVRACLPDSRTESVLVVPLFRVDNEPLGNTMIALLLASLTRESLFPDDDLQMLQLYAEQVEILLSNIELTDELRDQAQELELQVAGRTRQLSERNARLEVLYQVTTAANEGRDLVTSFRIVVDAVSTAFGFDVGNAFLPGNSRFSQEDFADVWHLDPMEKFQRFRTETERMSSLYELRGVSDAFHDRRSIWFSDIASIPGFKRAGIAVELGLRGALFIPVLVGDEPAAVLEFFTQQELSVDEEGLSFFTHLGVQLGRAVERRDAEQAIMQSEKRFRELFESQPTYCYLLSSSGVVEAANRSALSATGFAIDAVIGARVLDLFAPEYKEAIARSLEALATGSTSVEEAEIRTFSGRPRTVVVSLGNFGIVSGGARPAVMVQTDITEQRRAAAERDRLFEISVDMVAVVGFDGRFVRVNPAWEKQLGWTAGELVGTNTADFMHAEELARTSDNRTALREGKTVYDYETRFRAKSGEYRWLSWSAVTIRDQNEVFAVARDITERKRLDKELRELNSELERRVSERTAHLQAVNKELEAFSFSVSHDLRAPLRAVDGFSQALLEDYYDHLDDDGKDFLSRIRRESQRMGELIDDLIGLSRLTRTELTMELVDLSEMARQVMEELRAQFSPRDAAVTIEAGLSACADRRLVEALIRNLLSNAWKFTAKKPVAEIHVGRTGSNGSSEFYVRDNGAGFNMSYAGKLFGAFQRLHAMDEFEGTGIGLAIVQRVVNRHGGTVRAEAEIEKGATFYFTLGGHNCE